MGRPETKGALRLRLSDQHANLGNPEGQSRKNSGVQGASEMGRSLRRRLGRLLIAAEFGRDLAMMLR